MVQMVLVAGEMVLAILGLVHDYEIIIKVYVHNKHQNHINQWHWLIGGCWDFAFYEKNHPLEDIRSDNNRIVNH